MYENGMRTEQREVNLTQEEGLALVGEFDAQKWAAAFCKAFAGWDEIPDEGTMIGWFANAIMAGHDFVENRQRKEREAALSSLSDLRPGDELWISDDLRLVVFTETEGDLWITQGLGPAKPLKDFKPLIPTLIRGGARIERSGERKEDKA